MKQNKTRFDVKKKNRRKVIKTIAQFLILLAAGYALYHGLVEADRYVEPDKSSWTNRDGFIALSYFGVNRNGSPKLMARDTLDDHLKVLHDLGFVTISQQDILDFYEKGSPLPERALFLSFEDGRIDSHLYGHTLLEKYNFRATFLTYANKMGNSENKFMQPNELLKMKETGFWELGTNGYRLTYINIFDENGKFLGVIDESDVSDKSNFEYYNHYLMDFIRDENMIPVETRSEMEQRIAEDYRLMERVYTRRLGAVPPLYMIMHANALYSGMHELVEQANDAQIRSLFRLHFNREGDVYNSRDDDVFNLTRVQPAPYWPTNHLLMKIRQDTGWDLPFVTGEERMARHWETTSGAAEFKDHAIIVTSPPNGEGLTYFSGTENLRNVRWTVRAAGNVIGKQSVYVRYDREQDSYVRVQLENNVLHVDLKRPGEEPQRVFSQKLSEIEWKGEDVAFDKASVYSLSQAVSGRLEEPDYPINIRHKRRLDITVQDERLKVAADNRVLLDGMALDGIAAGGGTALGAERNEQNKKEDIYDAVFDDVEIVHLDAHEDEASPVLFRSRHEGWEEWMHRIREWYSDLVDLAIETF